MVPQHDKMTSHKPGVLELSITLLNATEVLPIGILPLFFLEHTKKWVYLLQA
jgi:hypothetical protein